LSAKIVIDASMALAWSLEDERSGEALAVLDHVEAHGAIVPTLWSYEVANVLALLVRRKRIDTSRAADIGFALDALAIARVPPDAPQWRATTIALAERHKLSAYDAAYLRLALDAGARLASLDRPLVAAARKYGIAFPT